MGELSNEWWAEIHAGICLQITTKFSNEGSFELVGLGCLLGIVLHLNLTFSLWLEMISLVSYLRGGAFFT